MDSDETPRRIIRNVLSSNPRPTSRPQMPKQRPRDAEDDSEDRRAAKRAALEQPKDDPKETVRNVLDSLPSRPPQPSRRSSVVTHSPNQPALQPFEKLETSTIARRQSTTPRRTIANLLKSGSSTATPGQLQRAVSTPSTIASMPSLGVGAVASVNESFTDQMPAVIPDSAALPFETSKQSFVSKLATRKSVRVTAPRMPPPKTVGGVSARKPPAEKPVVACLPKATIRSLALENCSTIPISPDAVDSLQRISQEFFSGLGKDLSSFAEHAKRRTIEVADVQLLMSRQRLINDKKTLSSLLHESLPMEMVENILHKAERNVDSQREDGQQSIDE